MDNMQRKVPIIPLSLTLRQQRSNPSANPAISAVPSEWKGVLEILPTSLLEDILLHLNSWDREANRRVCRRWDAVLQRSVFRRDIVMYIPQGKHLDPSWQNEALSSLNPDKSTQRHLAVIHELIARNRLTLRSVTLYGPHESGFTQEVADSSGCWFFNSLMQPHRQNHSQLRDPLAGETQYFPSLKWLGVGNMEFHISNALFSQWSEFRDVERILLQNVRVVCVQRLFINHYNTHGSNLNVRFTRPSWLFPSVDATDEKDVYPPHGSFPVKKYRVWHGATNEPGSSAKSLRALMAPYMNQFEPPVSATAMERLVCFVQPWKRDPPHREEVIEWVMSWRNIGKVNYGRRGYVVKEFQKVFSIVLKQFQPQLFAEFWARGVKRDLSQVEPFVWRFMECWGYTAD